MAALPQTRYAQGEDGYVAFQTFGEGQQTCLFIPAWLQNLDVMWDEPTLPRYLNRLASFSRVICFDKRGTGVSDPVPLTSLPTLEEWADDARLAMDASGVEQVVAIGDGEGGPLAISLAATFPDRVTSLVLINSFARWIRADDYPIGMPLATWEKLVDHYEQNWGVTAEILGLTAPSMSGDQRFRDWYLRYQRLAMPRGAAAAMYRWITSLDVRSVLKTIAVPTLVITRANAAHHRSAFGRYLAGAIPNAHLVEIPGADTHPPNAGDFDPVLDQVELFVAGSIREPTAQRRLATVLFTDIVGSTRLAASKGDSTWLDLRSRHDQIVREHLRLYRGREMNYTGDGFLALFDGPARAATCAYRLAAALAAISIRVRAGLHTGEVEEVGGHLGGLAVNIAARVMAAAAAGGVLASGTVKDLVLGSGIEFTDAGRHVLRDVPGEWQLYEVTSIPQ